MGKKIFIGAFALPAIIFTTMIAKNTTLSGRIENELFALYGDLPTVLSSMESPEGKTDFLPTKPKHRTICIYIAANNDLEPFAGQNLKQMIAVGSDDHTNVVVEIYVRKGIERLKNCFRYYVNHGSLVPLEIETNHSQNSGTPEAVVEFVRSCKNQFPAKNFDLIMWNHGTGATEPRLRSSPSDLAMAGMPTFMDRLFNPFQEAMKLNDPDKGVCFDESYHSFIENINLRKVVRDISENVLNGEKIGVIGFDACLMGMIEVANFVSDYADFMVASEEVVPGWGWNYERILRRLSNHQQSNIEVATAMVESYGEEYGNRLRDFTLSAVKLEHISALRENISTIATLLSQALDCQVEEKITYLLKAARYGPVCTHFANPSYIDILHWYNNVARLLPQFQLQSGNIDIIDQLKAALLTGEAAISKAVAAKVTGREYSIHTGGLAIYFPETRIHPSYSNSDFFLKTAWGQFLQKYIDHRLGNAKLESKTTHKRVPNRTTAQWCSAQES